MSISSLGVGSGLDLGSLLDQLVAAERAPAERRLNIREAGLQAQFSAFGTLSAAVQSLRDAAQKLSELSPSRSASVSGAIETVTATATEDSVLGNYSVIVEQLAASQNLASQAFSSASELVGSGTLTIAFGSTDYDPDTDTYNGFTPDDNNSSIEIEIGPGDQTLSDIRDAINEADGGVSASIVTDINGPRLVLSADDTGTNNTLQISVDDDDGNDLDGSGLSALAFNDQATNLEQTVAATDAQFSVNGLSLTSTTNSGISAVQGLSINLLATSTEAATVRVENRDSSVTSGLKEFADAYNELVDLNAQLASFDPETRQAGTLFGDTTLRGLISSMRTSLSGSGNSGAAGPQSFLQIGLATGEDGKLSVDSEAVQSFLEGGFEQAVDSLNAISQTYAEQTDAYLDGDGLLSVRTDGIQTRLNEIGDDRIDLAARIENLETRLTRRFANLDTLLANLRNTSDFISNQLSNLNVRQQSGN